MYGELDPKLFVFDRGALLTVHPNAWPWNL